MGQDIRLEDDPDTRRYEFYIDGERVGFASYRREPGRLVIPHTEVDPSLRGKGIGSQLVDEVLREAEREGLEVIPRCSFVARHMRRQVVS